MNSRAVIFITRRRRDADGCVFALSRELQLHFGGGAVFNALDERDPPTSLLVHQPCGQR